MNRIVKILMRRDGLSDNEAWNVFESAKSEIMDAIYGTSCLDPEEVLADELGLEPDYLEEILDW